MIRLLRHVRAVGVLTLALLLILVGSFTLTSVGLAQLGLGRFYLATDRGVQFTASVDTSLTPNKSIFGCETDVLASATVNGVDVQGGATGVDPTVTARACTGGDANINIALAPLGTGVVKLGGVVTSGAFFVDAVNACKTDNATVNNPPVRAAANDWNLTQGASLTVNYHCVIQLPFRTTAAKGIRVDSFSISQAISGAALTSNSAPTLSTTTYVNNTANAVATYGGAVTITQPTAIQALPYLTAATLAAPAFMVTGNALVSIDWTVVTAVAGTYKLNGIGLVVSIALY